MRSDKATPGTMPFLLLTVSDYQMAAKDKLPKAVYEYLTSGADEEQTVVSNETAFAAHWRLRPHILRPVNNLSTSTVLFGHILRMPLFASPAGVQGLFHPDGECYTAGICHDFGIPYGLSQHSTRSIEEIGSNVIVGGGDSNNLWYQIYILKDRMRTIDLIRRVVATRAYSAIVLTVDSVRFGVRHADARNGFNALPYPHRLVNYDATFVNADDERPADETYNSKQNAAWDQNSEQLFDPNLTFDDIGWIKSIILAAQKKQHNINNNNDGGRRHQSTLLPVIVKGVMTAEDAVACAAAGADAIVVSNHGGRQLDGCLASIDALPAIVSALRSQQYTIPILLDGGVRRGTDILKALALGADAVGIGRPLFYGLAVNDLPGLLSILQRELETAMALCGARTIADIDESLVQHCSCSPYHQQHDHQQQHHHHKQQQQQGAQPSSKL
jgi:isopentenyl diphosphate isomerase/L-lactate dehydrogenase-like FMN-dependent dehydrogenase